MMKYFWTYLTLLVLFVLQTTVGRYINIFGIAPNLVFVFAVCYAMYNFPVRSAVLCVVAGLLADIYGSGIMGINGLLYMYIGLAVSLFGSTLMKKSTPAVAIGVMVVSVLYQTVYFLICYTMRGYGPFVYTFVRLIIPGGIYDGAAALLISMWTLWLSEEHIRGF